MLNLLIFYPMKNLSTNHYDPNGDQLHFELMHIKIGEYDKKNDNNNHNFNHFLNNSKKLIRMLCISLQNYIFYLLDLIHLFSH